MPLPSGETLLERTARIGTMFGSVLVVGRNEPDGWTPPESHFRVHFLPDDTPDAGPAAGLRTALRQAEAGPSFVALSCDLPLLTLEAVVWLKDAAADSEIVGGQAPWHGLIPVVGGQWQSLFAVYTAACLPLLEANLSRGERSLRALIQAGNFTFVDAPPEVAEAIANVNTPDDWANVAARL